MKLLLMLVFLRPAICAIMGNKPVCPGHTSVSILNPSAEENDPVCDLCEYLNPRKGCSDMNLCCPMLGAPVMVNKLVADCKRIAKSRSRAQLQWFSDVLVIFCNRTEAPPFDGPICGCDPCSELVKTSKPFMKVCAPQMTPEMVSERLHLCKQVKQDQEELWFFYQDLKNECFALTGENITFSFCDCDVCWLLFYETSDFMEKCGKEMDQAILNKLFSSCEKIMCNPVRRMDFKDDLELICEKKFNVTFEFPQCACEECWLLFQKDSDFMQKCGLAMSADMLKKVKADCYANLDNLDDFIAFIDNLQVTCQNKGKEQFQHEWCYCIDCLLFENREKEIWKDCISHMPESVRSTKRKECLNATLEGKRKQYKSNLFQYCNVNYGCNVTFPECKGCSRTDLSVVFANDYSPSMRNSGKLYYQPWVFELLDRDSIGQNKTNFGIIRFDHIPHYIFTPDLDCTTYWGCYILQHNTDHYYFGFGTVFYSMLVAIGDIFRKVDDNRTKYAVISTDGYKGEMLTWMIEEACDTIPKDVTVLVVGIGYTDVHNLLMLARNKPQNVYNYNPASRNDKYLMNGYLMRKMGC